ncbi:MAG TPA: hypothetical protein VKB75_17390 [Jatrophihabitans sp.]|nr:hypothetical protein [Jatrophihabitans sp.]
MRGQRDNAVHGQRRANVLLGARRLDRRLQRVEVIGTVVALAVDEERRGAGRAADVGRLDVLPTRDS